MGCLSFLLHVVGVCMFCRARVCLRACRPACAVFAVHTAPTLRSSPVSHVTHNMYMDASVQAVKQSCQSSFCMNVSDSCCTNSFLVSMPFGVCVRVCPFVCVCVRPCVCPFVVV